MAAQADPQLIKRLVDEFYAYEEWLPKHFTLHTKAGDRIPSKLSPAGLRLFEKAEAQRRKGIPVRLLALKARQVFMSYATALYLSRLAMFLERQHTIVYTHEHKSTKKIFRYYDEIHTSYQGDAASPRILPMVRRVQDAMMEFEGGGIIDFGSAENTKGGRSSANRHLHLSEYAFWRDAGPLMTGLMASVPKDPGTTVIVESTANGMAGDFFEFWEREKQKGSGWTAIFFAWWEHPEYALPLTMPRDRFQESLTREERDLIATYRLTFEQINWRRFVLQTDYKGNVDTFRQEYPSNPEEAFLMSGRPRFDRQVIARQPVIEQADDGELVERRVGSQTMIQFSPIEAGPLRMFRRPEKGHSYVIGADTSEGIDVTGDQVGYSDPDYSVAVVLDRESGDMVARFRARVHPAEFGRILADLGHVYNGAFLVPEVNNTGLATLEELERQDYPREMIYTRDRDPDDQRTTLLYQLGWKTTTTTRPILISTLEVALVESAIYVRDNITRGELYRFVISAKGKAEAASGAHDDCVIALALAVIGLQSAPRMRIAPRGKPAGAYTSRLGGRGAREDDDDE